MEFLYLLEKIRVPLLDQFFLAITTLGEETAFLVISLVVFWCVDKYIGYYACNILVEKVFIFGVYVEVKQEENDWGPGDLYCTCESKVYIVKNGKIVYSEILLKYIEESDDWFETEEEDSDC